MRRVKYTVIVDNETARFSDSWHAMMFAAQMSRGDRLIEVRSPEGLIGQYRNGLPTEEFQHHHDCEASFARCQTAFDKAVEMQTR